MSGFLPSDPAPGRAANADPERASTPASHQAGSTPFLAAAHEVAGLDVDRSPNSTPAPEAAGLDADPPHSDRGAPQPDQTLRQRWRRHWQAFSRDLSQFYHAPYRRTMARAARDEDDLFMLIVLGEALGLPNPLAYETVELYPLLLDEVHQWHLRAGFERSPFDQFGCC
ncbi:MAG: cory-CC-star protein [Actinomycetaceae bacterium]|nr:cory-CC-star protein [Actinomycetaceae bacterium]